MIEDAVTGFIIYTGMDPKDVKFITKSGCGGLANRANTCYGRNGASISATQLQSQMINSLNANEKKEVNGIRNRQQTYLKRLKTNAYGLAQPRDKTVTRSNNNLIALNVQQLEVLLHRYQVLNELEMLKTLHRYQVLMIKP